MILHRALFLLIGLSAFASTASAKANEEFNVVQTAHRVRGSDLAKGFAATCSPKNYKRFSEIAKRSGFFAKENAHEIAFEFTKSGLRSKALKLQASVDAKGIDFTEATGKTFHAEDGCDFFVTYRERTRLKEKSSAWLQLAAPAALAFTESENRTWDHVELSAASFGLAASVFAAIAFPPAGLIGGAVSLAFVAWDAYSGLAAGESLYTKNLFERFLQTSELTLTCDENSTILRSDSHKIVVRKTSGRYTVDFLDAKSEKTLVSDSNSAYAEKSRAAVIAVAKVCNSKNEAEAWTETLKRARTQVKDKIAQAEKEMQTPQTDAPMGPANAAPVVN